MSTWHPQMVAPRTSLGLPRHPIQIVATTRGLGFDGILFNVPDIPVVLQTIEQCSPLMAGQLARRPWIAPLVMPAASDLAAAFHQLRQRGIRRIVHRRPHAGHATHRRWTGPGSLPDDISANRGRAEYAALPDAAERRGDCA